MVNLQKGVLEKVERFLSKKKFNYEVIIVDDGSDDGSAEFVAQFVKENRHFRLIKNSHTGKAGAVTSGMLSAEGDFVLFTDMDQATPIEEVDKLLPYFEKRYDVVIGSRSSQRKGAPWTRLLMARGFMLLRTIILGLTGITDTQCGFKAFRNEASKTLFHKIRGVRGEKTVAGSMVTAGFDVELLFLAQKMGYKVKEVPVNWFYVETRRVSPVRDSIDGFIGLLKIRLNDLKGLYK